MAGDIGILHRIEVCASGQETDSSMNGQPGDDGVRQRRS